MSAPPENIPLVGGDTLRRINFNALCCHPLPLYACNMYSCIPFREEGSIQEMPEKYMLIIEVQRFFLLLQFTTSLLQTTKSLLPMSMAIPLRPKGSWLMKGGGGRAGAGGAEQWVLSRERNKCLQSTLPLLNTHLVVRVRGCCSLLPPCFHSWTQHGFKSRAYSARNSLCNFYSICLQNIQGGDNTPQPISLSIQMKWGIQKVAFEKGGIW